MPGTENGTCGAHRACPLCGHDNADRPPLSWSAGPWLLKACARCTLVYLENPVSYQSLDGNFAWRKTNRSKRESRAQKAGRARRAIHGLNRWAKRLRRKVADSLLGGEKVIRLVRRLAPSGPVLDIGCGRGKTLGRLPDRYTPFGLEIDADYTRDVDQACRLRGGLAAHGNALEGLRSFADGQFACVLMQSYLEHETRPREVLAAAVRVLQPGGHLVIKVPNYGSWGRRLMGRRWSGIRLPDHVNYFSPETLWRLVAGAGLEVAGPRFWDHWPLQESMWLCAKRPEAPKG